MEKSVMVKIKSFSVDEGDTFYIKHCSSNFTIIDCNLKDDKKEKIVEELKREAEGKDITRFISTHPDEDHIHGIEYLNSKMGIVNFYVVQNAVKKEDPSESFIEYCKLRNSDKAYYLSKGCSRKWMNKDGEDNQGKYVGSAGINILWPDKNNINFKDALAEANTDGTKVNNISPIIKYSLQDGVTVLWFGDLEFDYMNKICDDVNLPKADIIFAPHHGRCSGTIPKKWLDEIEPKIIVVGEAASKDLNYYPNYNGITQNSAKDITLICDRGKVDIYSSNPNYGKRSFLVDNYESDSKELGYYIVTLEV